MCACMHMCLCVYFLCFFSTKNQAMPYSAARLSSTLEFAVICDSSPQNIISQGLPKDTTVLPYIIVTVFNCSLDVSRDLLLFVVLRDPLLVPKVLYWGSLGPNFSSSKSLCSKPWGSLCPNVHWNIHGQDTENGKGREVWQRWVESRGCHSWLKHHKHAKGPVS